MRFLAELQNSLLYKLNLKNTNMEILNVVFIVSGILNSIRSFPMDKITKDKQIEAAEKCFFEKIEAMVGDEYDKQEVVENGYFEYDGVYIVLSWSELSSQ